MLYTRLAGCIGKRRALGTRLTAAIAAVAGTSVTAAVAAVTDGPATAAFAAVAAVITANSQ